LISPSMPPKISETPKVSARIFPMAILATGEFESNVKRWQWMHVPFINYKILKLDLIRSDEWIN
jgi:hypothetical protein